MGNKPLHSIASVWRPWANGCCTSPFGLDFPSTFKTGCVRQLSKLMLGYHLVLLGPLRKRTLTALLKAAPFTSLRMMRVLIPEIKNAHTISREYVRKNSAPSFLLRIFTYVSILWLLKAQIGPDIWRYSLTTFKSIFIENNKLGVLFNHDNCNGCQWVQNGVRSFHLDNETIYYFYAHISCLYRRTK